METIFESNRTAIGNLIAGRYDEAIASFRSNLAQLIPQLQQLPAVDDVADHLAIELNFVLVDVAPSSSLELFECDFCFYNKAFQMRIIGAGSTAEEEDGHATTRTTENALTIDSAHLASAVLLYNVALSFHLKATTVATRRRYHHLQKALDAYSMASQIASSIHGARSVNAAHQQYRGPHEQRTGMVELAIQNNMGNILLHSGITERAAVCAVRLRRVLHQFALTDGGQAVERELFHFRLNIFLLNSALIKHSSAA